MSSAVLTRVDAWSTWTMLYLSAVGDIVDVFIARQPIFDRQQQVYGYELLFRSGWDNVFRHHDLNQASAQVIANSLLVMGLDTMTSGRMSFVNCTRDALVKQYASVLPSRTTVVEVLEHVDADDEVVAACKSLKAAGYTLALDDFVFRDSVEPLLALADIIKVDVLNSSVDEQRELFDRCGGRIPMLAEKVETREEFDRGLAMGYRYFQGYFFSKPVVLNGRHIPTNKLSVLELLGEINRSDLDYTKLERILQREVSLSYKLLRYINSAAFAFRSQIGSLKQAMVLLGEREVKKFASLIALADMGHDKPGELLVTAVVRGRFGEVLAPKLAMGDRGPDLFLTGLFSVIDALMDRALPDLLDSLPLEDEIKQALMGRNSRFQFVHQLIMAYERGDWKEVARLSQAAHLGDTDLQSCYLAAVDWAQQTVRQAL
ncbi:MAG TPA: HDOD domain-containing protein [Nitrospiria bacterium]|nr:HDOD domain-containing protein [Nitrospiria bacterium]